MSHPDDEIDDAWYRWIFGVGLPDDEDEKTGFSQLASLEARGYKWSYVAVDIPHDLPIGQYALLVDEVDGVDVLVSKELVRPRLVRAYDLVPMGVDTEKAAARLTITHYFDKHGGPIEVTDSNGWVAVIHPATRKDIKWQGSMFDANGPYSHKEGQSVEEVLDQLIEDGFRTPSPGAMDKLSTEDFHQVRS